MRIVDFKHCPICDKDLPVSEFGICRARTDGHNLYCKSCIRAKVTVQRRALKEYKELRRKYAPQIVVTDVDAPPFDIPDQFKFKLSPVDRVRNAIRNGARTQAEIRSETKLGKDEIGDAIANLLLCTHEIRTQIVDETRMYFLKTVWEKPVIEIEPVPFFDIARKLGAPSVKGEKRIQRVA